MKHDNEWLGSRCDQTYADTDHVMPHDIAFTAMEYHEHMARWRSLDELPESGQRIENAYSVGGKPDSSYVVEFTGTFDPFVYAWRPAGELPDNPLHTKEIR